MRNALIALALAATLAPAGAAARDYGKYAPLHPCPQVMRNYDKGNNAWRDELSWLLGFIDGASVASGININKFLEDGDPVAPALIFCRESKSATLWDAAHAVMQYAMDQRTKAKAEPQ